MKAKLDYIVGTICIVLFCGAVYYTATHPSFAFGAW
jgi:hypothetical protein